MSTFFRCASIVTIILSAVTTLASMADPSAGTGSPTAIKQLAQLQDDLRRAHKANDIAAYLGTSKTLHDFLNGSPDSTLQLMLAEVMAGKDQDASESLRQFVQMGQSNEAVLQMKQLAQLRAMPEYSNLHAAMVANDVSYSIADEAFPLAEKDILPEDIDYDAHARLFYITSILKKQILAVDKDGNAHVFAAAPDNWPMVALKVDAPRHLLWATEVAMDGFSWTPKEDWGKSAILVYDSATGKLLWRVEGPPHASPGDMTLTSDGDAIISDGDGGGVYQVHRATHRIERIDAGDFISPQTPAVAPGGKQILIPDYVRGIGVLDLKTKHVSWIPTQGSYALSGIDGLYLDGRTLIATQNGTSPQRVIGFHLDPSLSHIESESIIERASPTLGDPTHGVVVKGNFYYIANSGWSTLDEHGNLKPGSSMTAAHVMRIAIPLK
jgi:hypothetical protein